LRIITGRLQELLQAGRLPGAVGTGALIKAVLTDDGADGLLPYLTTRSDALIRAVTERHVDYLRSHWPDLPDDDLEFVADTVVRLTVSHIVTPSAPADVTARQIAHLVDRLLPGGTPT
jgi:hypothetical protein